MKKIFFLLLIASLVYSCKKDNLVPNDDIPNWLQERIADDELAIKSNPQSGLDIAAWIRYEFAKKYYFEYDNMLSSSGPPIYTYEGAEVSFTDSLFEKYIDEKCCKQYVWIGPSYFGDSN